MNDILRELRSAELDWIDCGDEENAELMAKSIIRITALEKACQAYLDAYDSATGTVYVEPVIRAVMEEKNV